MRPCLVHVRGTSPFCRQAQRVLAGLSAADAQKLEAHQRNEVMDGPRARERERSRMGGTTLPCPRKESERAGERERERQTRDSSRSRHSGTISFPWSTFTIGRSCFVELPFCPCGVPSRSIKKVQAPGVGIGVADNHLLVFVKPKRRLVSADSTRRKRVYRQVEDGFHISSPNLEHCHPAWTAGT